MVGERMRGYMLSQARGLSAKGVWGDGGGQERQDWHAAIYIWIIGVNKHRVKVWKRKNKMGNFVNTAVTVLRSVSL